MVYRYQGKVRVEKGLEIWVDVRVERWFKDIKVEVRVETWFRDIRLEVRVRDGLEILGERLE